MEVEEAWAICGVEKTPPNFRIFGLTYDWRNCVGCIPWLKLTANCTSNKANGPQKEVNHLLAINFQGRAVSFREGIIWKYKLYTFHEFLGLMSCVVLRKLGPRTPGNNLQCFLMAGLISNIPIIATLWIDISELALYLSRGIQNWHHISDADQIVGSWMWVAPIWGCGHVSSFLLLLKLWGPQLCLETQKNSSFPWTSVQ